MSDVQTVPVTIYTDPWCPFSWGAEPYTRRLEVEFGGSVRLRFVMGGMQHVLSDTASFACKWLKAADESGMPLDPRGVLADPPASTNPAGIAVRAVAEQADPGPYLRRLREAIFLERRRMDSAEALLDLAREVRPGLDLARLKIDLASHGTLEDFGADLERAKDVSLPTLEVDGRRVSERPQWSDLVAAAGGTRSGEWPLSVEDALRRFAPLAAAEVAVLCDMPAQRAEAELWRLASDWKARPRKVLFGEVWEAS